MYLERSNASGVSSPDSGFGARAGRLGSVIAGMGLPVRAPSATSKVKNWFQVDEQRWIEAAA
jgi:hypothetical protein